MIIAFGNKARQGKDTCCEAVMRHYNRKAAEMSKHGIRFHSVPKVMRVNFADALRREITEAINKAGGLDAFMSASPIVGEHFPSWVELDPNPDMTDSLLPHGKHPKLLQWWGTEYRRAQDADYWVKRWLDTVTKHKGIVVTSDMRFLNECKAVSYMNGHTVNVTRVNRNGLPYFDVSRPQDHKSEIELDGYEWDFYLKAVTGQTALLEQYAITLAEYLYALET